MLLSTRHILIILFVYGFVLAGLMQYFGLAPVVPVTLLFAIISLLFYAIRTRLIIKVNKIVFFSVLFVLYIIFSGVYNGTNSIKTMIYLSFVIIPLGIFFISKSITQFSDKFLVVANYLAIFQLPILLLQKYLGPTISQYSAMSYHPIDGMFGTFPVADDHGLGFFLICLLFLHLFVLEKKSWLNLILFSCLLGGGIYLIGSNISKLLFVLLILFFLGTQIGIYLRFSLKNLFVIIFLSIIVLLKTNFVLWVGRILGINELSSLTKSISIGLVETGMAGRLQTLVYFYFKKVFLLVGNGPFSYFDPISGEFGFNYNFSQIIWFYYDIGIIGVILFLFWFVLLIRGINLPREVSHLRDFLLFCFFVYSFYTTTLNSITILSMIFLTLRIIRIKHKTTK